jgi:hypothetical protein
MAGFVFSGLRVIGRLNFSDTAQGDVKDDTAAALRRPTDSAFDLENLADAILRDVCHCVWNRLGLGANATSTVAHFTNTAIGDSTAAFVGSTNDARGCKYANTNQSGQRGSGCSGDAQSGSGGSSGPVADTAHNTCSRRRGG